MIWHPHIHCLVTDGVFDKEGIFHPVPVIDDKQAMLIFREKVFAMLHDNHRISEGLISRMRNWRHSGFSVHKKVFVGKDDSSALENLAKYITHPSFSIKKIKFIEETGCVIYKSSQVHLGKKRNFEVLDAIEFLHRLCLHIPDPYESLIRYYGYYANAARGKRKKLGMEREDRIDLKVEFSDDVPSRKRCNRTWAKLIQKVYVVNPLTCQGCGSRMKILSFVQDYREIKKILIHIGLWPVQYPEMKDKPARASPLYGKLLAKLRLPGT